MTPTEQAIEIASAISDGINCLAHLQGLRGKAYLVSAGELAEWRETLDRLQSNIKAIQASVEAGQAETSLSTSPDLLRFIEAICAHLSAMAPGAQIAESLCDIADAARAELAKP